MRARWTTIAVLAGCGFNPGGEGGGGNPDALADPDAAASDGPLLDAPPVDIDALLLPIDAPAIDGRPACPLEYDVVRPSGRYDLRAAMLHGNAKADCEGDLPGRTHLATFEDAEAFDDDVDAVGPSETAVVYIGGHCSEVDCESRENWEWDTGGDIDEGLWPQGQPNLGFSQRVLATQRFNGDWVLNNVEATSVNIYICECDP